MIRLILRGKTFEIKDELKALGFKWNAVERTWFKNFEDDDEQRAFDLKDAWESNGVYGETAVVDSFQKKQEERKYLIKGSWLFNLESMHDRIWCMVYDIREGKIELPFTVAKKTINSEDDLLDLLDEAEKLQYLAHGKVTGAEYGRIKEIVSWRVEARYATCLANGMTEADAGRCFEDM